MKLMLFEDFINKEVSKEERKQDTKDMSIDKKVDKKDLSKIKDTENSEEVIKLPDWDQY
jgi:hypothetical protein